MQGCRKGPEATEKAIRLLVYGSNDDEWHDVILALNFDAPWEIDKACERLEIDGYPKRQASLSSSLFLVSDMHGDLDPLPGMIAMK